jgi:hypothetical protein
MDKIGMNPKVWGGKIWFILHRLSLFSDRTDIIGAWKRMLKELYEIMPCALCKEHMGKYCMTHPISGITVLGSKGSDVKKVITNWVYQFHNTVNNIRNVKKFEKENLKVFYGYGTRSELVQDINRTVIELEKLWPHVPMRSWKESLRILTNLVGSGPLG